MGGSAATATGGAGGGTNLDPTACSSGSAQSGDVTINLAGVQQKITLTTSLAAKSVTTLVGKP